MMCKLCRRGIQSCQDCGQLICYDGGDDLIALPYVTESGDLFCEYCGPHYDEEDDDDPSCYDFYGADWYDPDSNLDELEPDETPRGRYIGPGSEYGGHDGEK